MSPMFGCGGRLLVVDLTTGEVEVESYDEAFARKVVGGNGLAAAMIWDRVPSDTEALQERNAVVFTVGPLTDTPIWGTSRGHMACLSPQSKTFADSNYGGEFAAIQKRTGFDAIFVTGRSARPVYLLVTEDGAELKDARHLWGLDTRRTMDALQSMEGKRSVCACIGPAGENSVVFANVILGGARQGTAGRCGMGAVMGSKNLKAAVVRGNKRTQLARPEELRAFLRENRKKLPEKTSFLTEFGTSFLVKLINDKGLLGTHNNAKEFFDRADEIGHEALFKGYVEGSLACPGCPVACGKKGKVKEGPYAGQTVKLPEYESIYAMGSMLDNADLSSIIQGNLFCDLLGMDTVSMGVTLSFAAECIERGACDPSELGERIDFSDGPGMVDLIRKTALRDGVGDLLALGSQGLADRLGSEAVNYLYCVKGVEIPGHSARGVRPLGLGYATGTRGGSHHDTRPRYIDEPDPIDVRELVEYNVHSQNISTVGDCLVICRFVAERGLNATFPQCLATLLNFATGWDMDLPELERVGERVCNLERMIGVSRGLRRKDDTLPYRVLNEPIPDGPAKGTAWTRRDLEELLDAYYDLRGWDGEGIPTEEKLAELDL